MERKDTDKILRQMRVSVQERYEILVRKLYDEYVEEIQHENKSSDPLEAFIMEYDEWLVKFALFGVWATKFSDINKLDFCKKGYTEWLGEMSK